MIPDNLPGAFIMNPGSIRERHGDMSQLLFTLAQQAPILLLLGTENVIGFVR